MGWEWLTWGGWYRCWDWGCPPVCDEIGLGGQGPAGGGSRGQERWEDGGGCRERAPRLLVRQMAEEGSGNKSSDFLT